MMKLLRLWSDFGVKVMNGYGIFVGKVGALAIIVTPLMLIGFSIPWLVVTTILITLNMIQGRIVYGLSFKEQYDCVKEGIIEGLNEIDE